VNGIEIKRTDLGSMFTQIQHHMKDNGRMIGKKDMELRFGLMVHIMKVNTFKEKNMEKEKLVSLMDRIMKAIFMEMIFTGVECMY